MESTLYILTGFTAVGKTRLSLDWAKGNNAEIISCDSLLFYRGMDIGTAKPTKREQAEVPHHFLDVTDVSKRYSVNEYVSKLGGVVEGILSRGKTVLVVGGSGFYLNSFFAPVVDEIEVDEALRSMVEKQFNSQSLRDSVEALRALNPDGLGELDSNNPRRVYQAWLRGIASGKTLAELKRLFSLRSGMFDSYEKQLLVLSRPQEELEARIRFRADAMLSSGLIAEVEDLLPRGIEANSSAANAIGYRETIAYLKGEIPRKDLAEIITLNTRKLLKKQRTWFKKFLPEKALYPVSGAEALPEAWHRISSRTVE